MSTCACKHRKNLDPDSPDCKYPTEVCLHFGRLGQYIDEQGLGRQIIVEEAHEILHQAADELPPGVSFGGWVQQGSALPPSPADSIAWRPHNVPAGESYAIRFTANITDAEAFARQTITSTAYFTSTNGGSGSDDAVFTVAPAIINTPPAISAIADQKTTINTSTDPILFTVHDAETALDDLALSAASSDLTLVPPTTIVFGGSGANRTVTIAPTTNLTETATITITVTDDGSLTDDTAFVLIVEPFRLYLPLVASNS